MPRNIVVLIDGTLNSEVIPRLKRSRFRESLSHLRPACIPGLQEAPTNVSNLNDVITLRTGPLQEAKYFSGIGANNRGVRRLASAATGAGFTNLVLAAYEFVNANYQPGDNLYLFGFSRGAFASLVLASFMGFVGSLPANMPPATARQLIQLYERRYTADWWKDPDHYRRALARLRGRNAEHRPIHVHFLGIWDAVAAIGLPDPTREKFGDWGVHWAVRLATQLPPHISNARHALALHELRLSYRPILFRGTSGISEAGAPQTLKQCWFPGNHADVGGGYAGNRLAATPLAWIQREAESLGLHTKVRAPAYTNFQGSWGVHFETCPKGFGVRPMLKAGPGKSPNPDMMMAVHLSALQRLDNTFPRYHSYQDPMRGHLLNVDDLTRVYQVQLATHFGRYPER